ncbi:alpha/beta hydrolase fold domain-containing protein [Flavobacterium sp. RSSA_27]|uniref:alpha/beta hydrolase fold domain-containing protein n=1 Tax=Flavobacterium sp. RSSA_27 TaxID=3447667 RepID=UPI003F307347
MKRIVSLLLLSMYGWLYSQKTVSKDTSYTVQATFQKDLKKYPNITLAPTPNWHSITFKKDLVYQKTPHRTLHFDAFLNTSKTPLPAVLLLHGGGWKSGDKAQMKNLALAISQNGYQCFAIEYRLTAEAPYPASIEDCKKAVYYLIKNAKKYNINPTQISVLGCSAGGQMASLVGTTLNNVQPKTIASIINLDGILAFHHPDSEEGKIASEWLGGSFEEKPGVWKAASPLTHTSKNTPPVLFLNSDMKRFHAGRDEMLAILDQHHIYHETHTFEAAPHSFWCYSPWFEKSTDFIIQFLNTTVKKQP